MKTANNPENQNPNPHGLRNLVQISTEHAGTREQVEEVLDGLKRSTLTITIKALNGLTRGSYRVSIKQVAEYNEIQIRLYESNTYTPIATGFIDRGHTTESRNDAAEELRGLVRAYLCR